MITTERSVFVGAHITAEHKEKFRAEAARRQVSMSALISTILEEWLGVATEEQVETKRSNKRVIAMKEIDTPLPLEPTGIKKLGTVTIEGKFV